MHHSAVLERRLIFLVLLIALAERDAVACYARNASVLVLVAVLVMYIDS